MKIEASSSSSIGSNVRITVAANQGGRKYMEDRVHIETIRNNDGSMKFTFLGVFDGHGGYEASDYVRKNLLANIMACDTFDSEKDDDILAAIKEGFLTTHEDMTKVVGTWPRTASGYSSTAGTTSSVAIIRNGKLYTGHVGDSAIIIGSYKSLPDGKLGVDVDRVTIDHKPESLDEMTRIELAGGRVAVKSGVTRVVWTRPARGHIGPVTKNTPTESIPFLAVARSLGDLWSFCEATGQYVVSPEPDLAVRKLTDADSCIILVSDGITNVLSHNQIVHYVELEEKKLVVADDHVSDPTELREKQPNHARVILYQAMRRWGHLRADNLSAIVMVFDPVTANIEAYNPFFDEAVSPQQSVDEMFLMDPETMIHLAPTKIQKLGTERVPLLYEGAVDNNFVSVDYRGPGFLTHDEEEEIESRLLMREKLRESFRENNSPVIELDETVEFNDVTCPEAKENLNVTALQPAVTKSSVEGDNEDEEDDHSDEEEPTDSTSAASELSTTPTQPATITPKTRSAAKRIINTAAHEDQATPARKIAVAARRMSLVKTDTNVGMASISIEPVSMSGIVTRSRERQQNLINPTISTPSTSKTPVRNTLYMENGSRKRPSRIAAGPSAGITPFVGRMRIESSPITEVDIDHPVVRSEPSTPAKDVGSPIRASKWSLSKLDAMRAEEHDSVEPPSKIRRIYGFMKRLVGLGNN